MGHQHCNVKRNIIPIKHTKRDTTIQKNLNKICLCVHKSKFCTPKKVKIIRLENVKS